MYKLQKMLSILAFFHVVAIRQIYPQKLAQS